MLAPVLQWINKTHKLATPEPIYNLFYRTEDKIDNLLQSETDMEVLCKSAAALDQVVGNRTIVENVINSEMNMDKISNSKIAMDKVTDKLLDDMIRQLSVGMPGIKYYGSPYLVDTMWDQRTASEAFWDSGSTHVDPDAASYSKYLLGNRYIIRFEGSNAYDGGDSYWYRDINVTDISTLKIRTSTSLQREDVNVRIVLGGTILWETSVDTSWTERTFDISGHSGQETLQLGGWDDGASTVNADVRFGDIKLEG